MIFFKARCRLILFVLLFVCPRPLAGQSAQAPTKAGQLLMHAEAAHQRAELKAEEQLLLQALAEQPDDEEKARVLQRLANLAWRVFLDYKTAESYLVRADQVSARRADTAVEWARLETNRGNFEKARAHARQVLATAADDSDKRRARVIFASAVFEEIARLALDKDIPEPGCLRSRRPLLEIAFQTLGPLLRDEPGLLEASRLRLIFAVLTGNGPEALKAWRSYFHLWKPGSAKPPLTDAEARVSAILPGWNELKTIGADRHELVLGLAASRFYPEAALVAVDMMERDPFCYVTSEVSDILRYGRFCRKMEAYLKEQYRKQLLNGRPTINEFYDPLFAQWAAFWSTLSWRGEPPPFQWQEFARDLGNRFGAEFQMGTADLIWGHRIVDEQVTTEQYGKKVSFRFIAVDCMVSAKSQSVLWDRPYAAGGWSINSPVDGQSIVAEVRPSMASSAIRDWGLAGDPAVRKKEIEEIERFSAEEEAECRKNPTAVPTVLYRRVRLKGIDQLVAELKREGLSGAQLRERFIQEEQRLRHLSAILGHEGRHSIDREVLHLKQAGPESEYQAKLSEVVFAPNVFLGILTILNPAVTSNREYEGHRKANERLLGDIVNWMKQHLAEIKGIDRERPLLPQFHMLTEDQVRELFRSLDPLAK